VYGSSLSEPVANGKKALSRISTLINHLENLFYFTIYVYRLMAGKIEKTRKKPATKKKAKKAVVVKKKKVLQKQNVTQSVKVVIGDSKKKKAPTRRRVAAAVKTPSSSVPVVNYHRTDIPYYRAVGNERRPAPLFDDSVDRHQTHQARAIVPPDRDPNRDTGNDLLTSRDSADFRRDATRRFGNLTQRVAGGLGDVTRHVSRTSYQLGEDVGNLVEESNRRQTANNPSLTAEQVNNVVGHANEQQTQNQPPSLTRTDLDKFRETVDLVGLCRTTALHRGDNTKNC
jgi:hypothetical protein